MRKALPLLLALPLSLGCGTSCPEIVAHREAFSRSLMDTRPTTRRPDLWLSLPWDTVDLLLGDAVRAHTTPIAITPPGLAALQLSARLTGARAHPPDPTSTHAVGLTLTLTLERRGAAVLALEVKTGLTPELVRESTPGVRLAVAPGALDAVTPRTTPEGRASLSRWLERELPPAMRLLGSRAVVDALADELLAWVGEDVWPLVRRALPSGDLFETVLALPELELLGVRTLLTEAQPGALRIGLTTGATAPAMAPPRANPRRINLTMSGPTATALLSRAMDRGDLPGRFSAKGAPDPKGTWDARLGWLGGHRPLQLQLWQAQGTCQRAEVAAQVAVRVDGDELAVDVREGKLMSVAGPAFAEAFWWLEALFGEAIAFSFRTAALLQLPTAAGAPSTSLRLVRAQLEDTMSLDFELTR